MKAHQQLEDLHPITTMVAELAIAKNGTLRGLTEQSAVTIAAELDGMPAEDLAWAVRSLIKLAAHFELDLDDPRSASRIIDAASAAIPALEAAALDTDSVRATAEAPRVKRFHDFSAIEASSAARCDAPAPRASVRLSQMLPRSKIS